MSDPGKEAKAVLADKRALDNLVDDAINAVALAVQNRIGQTDGGIASLFFSDDEARELVEAIVLGYLQHEAVYDDTGAA